MDKQTKVAIVGFIAGVKELLHLDTEFVVAWNKDACQSIAYDPYADAAILTLSEKIFLKDTHGFFRSLCALFASIGQKRIQHLWTLFSGGKINQNELRFGLFKATGETTRNLSQLIFEMVRQDFVQE